MVLPFVKWAGNPQQGNVAKLALPIRNNPGGIDAANGLGWLGFPI